jgi:hypothetical protein
MAATRCLEGSGLQTRLDTPIEASYTPTARAGVAELADAQDSGSCGVHTSCGFKSHLRQNPRHLFDSSHSAVSLGVPARA